MLAVLISYLMLFIMENSGAVHVVKIEARSWRALVVISFFPTVSRLFPFTPSSLIDKVYIDSPLPDVDSDIHRRYDSYESRPKSSRPPFAFTLLIFHLVTGFVAFSLPFLFCFSFTLAGTRALACLGCVVYLWD